MNGEIEVGDYISYLPKDIGCYFKGVYRVEAILNENRDRGTMLVRLRLQTEKPKEEGTKIE